MCLSSLYFCYSSSGRKSFVSFDLVVIEFCEANWWMDDLNTIRMKIKFDLTRGMDPQDHMFLVLDWVSE